MPKKKVSTKGKTVVTGDVEPGKVKKVKKAPKPLKDEGPNLDNDANDDDYNPSGGDDECGAWDGVDAYAEDEDGSNLDDDEGEGL